MTTAAPPARPPLADLHPGSSRAKIRWHDFWRAASHAILRLFYGYRAENIAAVPQHGPLLIVANHESFLDPTVVGAAVRHRHLDYVCRESLYRIPLFGPFVRSLNTIPISRDGGDPASVKEILRRLSQGRAVVVFPEGARSEDGELQPFKRGVLLLLRRAKCPVLPAAVLNTYPLWPRQRRLPRIGGLRVGVRFGRLIPAEELLGEEPEAALKRLEQEVGGLKALGPVAGG